MRSFLRDRLVLFRLVAEDRFPLRQHERSLDQIRLFHHQPDGLGLGQFARCEVALFVGGTAGVDEILEVRFVDELLEELARGGVLRQIVFFDFDSATFQVGDRFAAARSAGLEVHLDFLRHFFLTHHALEFAAPVCGCSPGMGGG